MTLPNADSPVPGPSPRAGEVGAVERWQTPDGRAEIANEATHSLAVLRLFVRGKKSGGCKMLSEGDLCDCELCNTDKLAGIIRDLLAVARLRAAAQGGEGDTRRLDWLEGAQWASYGSNNDGIGWTVGTRGFVPSYSFAQTLRAAIDAAIPPNATRRSPDHGEGGGER